MGGIIARLHCRDVSGGQRGGGAPRKTSEAICMPKGETELRTVELRAIGEYRHIALVPTMIHVGMCRDGWLHAHGGCR